MLEKHPTRHVFQIQPLALHFSPRPYIQRPPVSQQRDRVQLFRYHALLLSCLLTPTFTVSCPHFSCMHYAFRLSSAMPGICLPCSLHLLGPLASFLQLLPGPVSYAFILFLAFGHRARPTTVLSSALAFLCPQTLRTQDTTDTATFFPPTCFVQLHHHSQDRSLVSLRQEFFLGHCRRHPVVYPLLMSGCHWLSLSHESNSSLVSLLLFVSLLFTLSSVHTRVASTWLSDGFLENF